MNDYVLDTNICLHVLRNTLAAPLPGGHYSVSAITEIELYAKPGLSAVERQEIRAFLSTMTLVELPPNVREEAARIRVATGLKLPDAIVAATATTIGAELLSNDRQLARVPGLVVTPLALRP